jgi:sigma-B regulation protein RsbU (phosphoserine phosphatase)
MQRLNDVLLERRVDAQYVTLLLMYWDAKKRELTMSNAGALPPMICRNGENIKVRATGIPLGLLEDREYDEVSVTLQPGDTLVLYSDGVQDQSNRAGDEYGTSRLFKMLKKTAELPPREIIQAIFNDIDQHTDGGPMSDDQSLIAMRVS